nr:hypothetical protein [Tanacetum cinerariifolium]
MDINIDALYIILKQNQGDVNDAIGSKKKIVVVTSDPLALIAEKINVSRSKEKVIVSSNSEGSEADDFSELKKITALLAKAFNRRKFYSKPTNNNLRTSSSSQSANKKQEFVKTDNKREINANMVFIAQIEKVLSDFEASSSSADEKIYEIHFEDDYFQEIINPDFEKIDSPFQKTSSLKLYVPNVILENIIIDLEDEVVNLLEKEKANLETIESLKSKVNKYTQTVCSECDFRKIIINLEDEVVSLLEKEKPNLKTIKSLKSKGFESSENAIFKSENQSENDCHVVEKECDKVENSKVIAPGMFKLSVSQSVSPISMSKRSCDSNNVEIKLKRKR